MIKPKKKTPRAAMRSLYKEKAALIAAALADMIDNPEYNPAMAGECIAAALADACDAAPGGHGDPYLSAECVSIIVRHAADRLDKTFSA